MTDNQRLQKALAKIEKRKQRQREKGITEPSKFGYVMRDLIAPLFRGAVSLMYPKSGCVLLGNINKRDIKQLTRGSPVIYAVTHRGILDVPRIIAHAIPHSYLISGGESVFYCTANEYLLDLNGVLLFDRLDRIDRKLVIERAYGILESNHSIHTYPEGIQNVYGKHMLKLYPGVINMALNTGAIVVPVGNEIHILRDKQSGKIVGDINYTMYEDYFGGLSLFRPGDDIDLATLHDHLNGFSYIDIVDSKKMERFICDGKFICGSVVFDLDKKLQEFLTSYPKIINFSNKHTKGYLSQCAILCEYNNMLLKSLSVLEARMTELSDKINIELDKRHPMSPEERERNSREYADYWLDVYMKSAKKGRMTIKNELDRYINRTTDESIIESVTNKVMQGLEILDN